MTCSCDPVLNDVNKEEKLPSQNVSCGKRV